MKNKHPIFFFEVEEWDRRVIDKTSLPRMPWHDVSLCVVNSFFNFWLCNIQQILLSYFVRQAKKKL